jgi:Cytochrome c554 and c-prime
MSRPSRLFQAVAIALGTGLAAGTGAAAADLTPWQVAQGSPLGGSLLQSSGGAEKPAGAAAPKGEAKGKAEENKGGALGGSLLGGGGLLQGAPAGGGTVFTGEPPKPPQAKPGAVAAVEKAEEKKEAAEGAKEHAALYKVTDFPSALQCGVCHPKQFREWSVSQHAYAEISVVFHAMQHTINDRVNGSNGDFCARCHSAVAGYLGESPDAAVLQRHPVSREGVTCISCHRISNAYNKVSGRLAFHPGEITKPVYGPFTDAEVKRVIKDPKYHVEPNPKKVGLHIHADAVYFAPIKSSTFCGQCHDVTLFNGFRLEEAFSEYRTGPSAAAGITCQDCHMGKVQGKVSGFEFGPAAMINGVPTMPRPLTNHLFSGPDYPIVHPGLFPFDKRAQDLANVNQWPQFDYKAGWGTDAFEKHIPPGFKFPAHWQSVDDRYDAAKIVQEHLKLLEFHKEKRLEVLRNGFGLGAIRVETAGPSGIQFSVVVRNLTGGHNVPTGFTAERPIWLQVTITDPHGVVVFKSGDRDPNGDLREPDSEWVRAGRVPLDSQLFNLESKTLIRNLRGTEQQVVLPIPFPQTALPFIRPSTFSQILLGRPTVARDEKLSIEPLGYRIADYSIDRDRLTGPGIYHVSVALMSQAVPVNLVLAIQYVGFDYYNSPRTVVDNLLAGAVAIAQRNFDVTVQ